MFLPRRDGVKARDRSRACTPMHTHLCTPCTRICAHASVHTCTHARSHVYSRHCVLLGASQAISLQFLPPLSLLQRALLRSPRHLARTAEGAPGHN